MPNERILIVEDESIVALDIVNSLESLGYVVAGQTDRGETAIQMAEEIRPDLVLMDVRLKGQMNGIQAAEQIYARFDIPIVFLSAHSDTLTLQSAMLSQAYGFIGKPFEYRELKSTIAMALYKHVMTRKLRESEERFALAVRAANDGIWDWNLKTNEIYYSMRWKEMLGYKENEIGFDPEEWFKRIHPDDQKLVQTSLTSHLKGTTSHFEYEYRIRHSNGSYLWVLSRGLAVWDQSGMAYRMAGSQSDITARKLAETRLVYDAVHDALTGLPNRVLFMDRLHNRLERTKRKTDDLFAIMFIDLDRFKVVNDSLGHAAGDQLLSMVSMRLIQCLRPQDTLSRFGGDEFAILLDQINEPEDARRVADRIRGQLLNTSVLGSVERSQTASIGIVLYNNKYQTAEELLRDADSAMYHAKSLGGNQHQFFDGAMHISAIELIKLEGELKHAVERMELLVQYQPIISLEDGKPVGAEALVRWNHPQAGLLLPKEFIDVAEETGLILPIGEYVLRTACLQAKTCREAGNSDFWVSVNVSGRQFRDKNLVDKIANILQETGLPGSGLLLEITETVAIRDMEYTIILLDRFEALGVRISLDDFGTGYSSLSYLKKFPLKVLKIDRSFVHDIQLNGKSESLITGIIAMARSLGMQVVAEGVEKEEQLDFLRAQQCNNVQGFLLGRPIIGTELIQMLNK